MKFIPGSVFTNTLKQESKPLTSGSVLANRMVVRPRHDPDFPQNTSFTLLHIRPKNSKVEYTFKNNTTKEIFAITFNSPQEADNRLEKFI